MHFMLRNLFVRSYTHKKRMMDEVGMYFMLRNLFVRSFHLDYFVHH